MVGSLQHIIQPSCNLSVLCVKLMLIVIKAEFINCKVRGQNCRYYTMIYCPPVANYQGTEYLIFND